MKIIECVQGSPEWLLARCGTPTASNFSKIVTSKGEPSKQAEKYMYQLAGERISGRVEEMPKTAAMQRGNDIEAEARNFYELVTGNSVEQTGFCLSDCGSWGASPDGLINEDGGLEVKVPLISTHIEYLLNGKVPTEYYPQVQGNMFVTGRKWLDFMSYASGVRPLIVRMNRDEEFISKLWAALIYFNENLNSLVTKLKEN